MTYQQAHGLLERYGQTQVLRFFDQLNASQQELLLAQIACIDWTILTQTQDSAQTRGPFEPLEALTAAQIDDRRAAYESAGLQALRQGKIGAVLLAGGQGTRLGCDCPKGTFDIGIQKPLYIFQALLQNLMQVVRQAGVCVPLFIMTSPQNDADTRSFLRRMQYFGYDENFIHFYRQDTAPCLDLGGRVLLQNPHTIATSPNGNGGWFTSLANAGMLDAIDALGITYLNVFAVDNVLQRIADPVFIGATLLRGVDCGAKVIQKADPRERIGTLCSERGRPSIVEYYELPDDMADAVDEAGGMRYAFGVILNYLFRVEKLRAQLSEKLPVHIAERKIPHIDETGNPVVPLQPNGKKLETLVVHMIFRMDSCLPFEVVRQREFAPIKNETGVDSIDTARELLRQNGVLL